jgi:hypothetical protein
MSQLFIVQSIFIYKSITKKSDKIKGEKAVASRKKERIPSKIAQFSNLLRQLFPALSTVFRGQVCV